MIVRHQIPLLAALLLAGVACSTAAQTSAQVPPANRLLVLLQDLGHKDALSAFFSALPQQLGGGLSIEFKSIKDASLRLKEYDQWLYEHLAIFAPKAEGFGGGLDVPAILEFIDSGHNLLLAASSEVSDTMRLLAAEVGVDLDEKGTSVFDHMGAQHEGDPTLIASSEVAQLRSIFGEQGVKAPVLFKGVAASVPFDSQLVTIALSAPATSYSHDPRKSMQDPPLAGNGISLVSLVQARNNARVMVAGSMDMFSDALFEANVASGQSSGNSGNREFTLAVAQWALQGRSVLKAENLRHRLLSSPPDTPSPSLYRVTDDVEFAIDIFEYEAGQKKPFKGDDVQVEFVMLDPYVRLPLQHDGQGTFSVQFKVPDVYGVFKYVLDYQHAGYSYIKLQKQVPVRPLRHNEFERFLVCAYPYYASAGSTCLAFFVLGWFYLYHKGN